MANLMSLKSLQNKPKRNGFDLSRKNAFTAKVGELLPVLTEEVLPGDKFKINLSSFTRTMPLNTAAYARIKEYYDFFFVPTHLLWRFSEQFYTNMNNRQHAMSNPETNSYAVPQKLPWTTYGRVKRYLYEQDQLQGKNMFGYDRVPMMVKLLEYLDYGITDIKNWSTSLALTDVRPFNMLPLLAYQKIYSDYFRFDQWERPDPTTFNADYYYDGIAIDLNPLVSGKLNYFDLRYCNYPKDMYFGMLPSPQYGDVSLVNTEGLNFSSISSYGQVMGEMSESFRFNVDVENGSNVGNLYVDSDGHLRVGGATGDFVNRISFGDAQKRPINTILINNLNDQFARDFSVLALRRAEAMQKWREISNSGDRSYKTQIEKHFGVSMPNYYSDMCQYLGGLSSRIDISEVVNQNITDNHAAEIAGKGVGVGEKFIDFEAKEHGVLMCIYHAVPQLDYTSELPNYFNQKVEFTDFAIPEFDAIGMERLRQLYLLDPGALDPGVPDVPGENINSLLASGLGYVPRYIEYKTTIDRVRGGFRDTLRNWVVPMDVDYMFGLDEDNRRKVYTYDWFKVNPSIMNTLFVAAADSNIDTDQLLVNSFFDVKAVRNLDRDGLPY